VHRMTLDQIDEAFNAGRIDENVMCLPADGSRWAKLGELAGLEGSASSGFAPLPSSLRPVSMNASEELDPAFTPRKSRMPLVFGGVVAIIAVVGAGFVVKNSGMLRGSTSTSVATEATPPVTATQPPAPIPPPPAPSPVIATAAPPVDTTTAAPATTADTASDKAGASGKGKGAKSKTKKKKGASH
jgi:hypothetical protein